MESRECIFLEVKNSDVSILVDCSNYGKRIREAADRLMEDVDAHPTESEFSTNCEGVTFTFGGEDVISPKFFREAIFFENTEYPIRIKSLREDVLLSDFKIAGHTYSAISKTDSEHRDFFGTINFHNQVGRTDFSVEYTDNGAIRNISFGTEVLSYKTDYRKDMREVIRDIEEEYAMLSYAFLKQTYLDFKDSGTKNSDLIWWQILKQCYNEIMSAARTIISSPRKRLKAEVKFERAERLKMIGPENEKEYAEFQDDPHHLYRTEDLILSKDTVENRFLKYVVKGINRRFAIVCQHIKNTIKKKDEGILEDLKKMEDELDRLSRNPFFRQIGQFKGFNQDSLVMKKARGYTDIYRNWLKLQCGYELAEGTEHLEVKDISELYEIWCFIRVKKIISEILGDGVEAKGNKETALSGDFVKKLAYGAQSEVVYTKDGKEIASLMYNAKVQEEDHGDEDKAGKAISAISGTVSFTTEQRPDIVLRIADENGKLEYTYLFDAKYRIADDNGTDVPPPDAIDQMHRYRDAILATMDDGTLRREIIGGDILYPGVMTANEVRSSRYYTSHLKTGIGAFPLRPGTDSVDVDPNSSEVVLREQIANWLNDSEHKKHLLEESIAHKGLHYILDEEFKVKEESIGT